MIFSRRRSPYAIGVAAIFVLTMGLSSATAAGPGSFPFEPDYDAAIAEAESKKAALEQEEEELDQLLEGTAAEIVEANARLRDLNDRLPEAQLELGLAEERLLRAQLQLEIAERKLDAAEQEDRRISVQIAIDERRMEELSQFVSELARSSYRGENSDSTLRLIFGAASTDDFVSEFTLQHTAIRTQGNALAEMEQLAAMNRNRAARQDAVREYAEELRTIAAKLVDESERARILAESRKVEIEELLVEQVEIKAFLEGQRATFLAELKKVEREQLEAEFELAILARKQLDAGLAYGDGVFAPPVSRVYVTSSYGYRIHPIYGVRIFHSGVDLRARCGVPIYAATHGQVEWAESKGGYGNQVMLSHGVIDGKVYMSSYNHMSRFNVSKGDLVFRGDIIGYSGTTGSSTACHLHFEILINGKTTDPMRII